METALFGAGSTDAELPESRRGQRHGHHGRTQIVHPPRQRHLSRPQPPAELIGRLPSSSTSRPA